MDQFSYNLLPIRDTLNIVKTKKATEITKGIHK